MWLFTKYWYTNFQIKTIDAHHLIQTNHPFKFCQTQYGIIKLKYVMCIHIYSKNAYVVMVTWPMTYTTKWLPRSGTPFRIQYRNETSYQVFKDTVNTLYVRSFFNWMKHVRIGLNWFHLSVESRPFLSTYFKWASMKVYNICTCTCRQRSLQGLYECYQNNVMALCI